MPGFEPAKLQGMNRVIEWIGANKDAVRDFINSRGGYRLLMNEENPIDIKSESTDGAYDADIGADFDNMVDSVDLDSVGDDEINNQFTGVDKEDSEVDSNE